MTMVSLRLPRFVADDRTGPGMQLRPTQGHRGLEQTGGRLRAHPPHLVSRSRGTRGRGLFLGIRGPGLRTLLFQALLDALLDLDPEGVHRLLVPPSRGGGLDLSICPADCLGELDALAG